MVCLPPLIVHYFANSLTFSDACDTFTPPREEMSQLENEKLEYSALID
jgi:hypothetical protein